MNHVASIIKVSQFDRIDINNKPVDWFKGSDGIAAIKGWLKGKADNQIVQSYLFDPAKFTVEEAKKWLKKNEVSFYEFIEAEEPEPIIEDEIKLGSRHNKADMETLQKVHTMAHEMIQHLEALGASPAHTPYQEVKSEIPNEWADGLSILEGEENA